MSLTAKFVFGPVLDVSIGFRLVFERRRSQISCVRRSLRCSSPPRKQKFLPLRKKTARKSAVGLWTPMMLYDQKASSLSKEIDDVRIFSTPTPRPCRILETMSIKFRISAYTGSRKRSILGRFSRSRTTRWSAHSKLCNVEDGYSSPFVFLTSIRNRDNQVHSSSSLPSESKVSRPISFV